MRMIPIIPIWIMFIICIFLIVFIIKHNKSIIHIIMVVLIFIINLRIMLPTDKSQSISNNLDVLFVVDNTISMNAEDYNGNKIRLDGVKNDCKHIIKKLTGARFSLITFNNTAKIVIPYTKDANMIIEAIDIMQPIDELYAKGSSLNTPLDTMKLSLNTSKNKNDIIRILFFISDGEITDESSLDSFKDVSKYVDNGAVLGYGTTNGGYMKTTSGFSEKEDYIMDYSTGSYGKAISKIDERNLKTIANDINIKYIYMNRQSNIDNKLNEIKNLANNSLESIDKSTYNDTYYFFIIPLLILLVFEFNKFRGKTL